MTTVIDSAGNELTVPIDEMGDNTKAKIKPDDSLGGEMEETAFDRVMYGLMASSRQGTVPEDLHEARLAPGGNLIETGGKEGNSAFKEKPSLTPAERASAVRMPSSRPDNRPSIPDLWSEVGGRRFVADMLDIATSYDQRISVAEETQYNAANSVLNSFDSDPEERTLATKIIADYQRKSLRLAQRRPIADAIRSALVVGDRKALREALSQTPEGAPYLDRL